MRRILTPVIFYLGILTGSLAVGNNIGSCVDVQCPLAPGTKTQASCQITNETLNAVGVATYQVPIPLPDPITANNNDTTTPVDNIWAASLNATFSWTVGISNWHHLVSDDDPYTRHIDRIYYLGTPPDVDLTADNLTYAGCALYMTGEDNKSVFYDPAANERSKHSYCRTLMGYSCHDAIRASAQEFARALSSNNSESSVAADCAAMAAHVQSTLSSSCPSLDEGTTVTGIPLTGPEAEKPIDAEQNLTSNCYPTLPKENNLTRAFSYNVTTLVYANETFPALLGETPLWSVFYSLSDTIDGGTGGGLEEPSVELVCLRPIDENMETGTVTSTHNTNEDEVSNSTSAGIHGSEFDIRFLGMALAASLVFGNVYM